MQSLRAAEEREELARPVWLEPGERGKPCGGGKRQGPAHGILSFSAMPGWARYKQQWVDEGMFLKISLHDHWRMNGGKEKVDLEGPRLEGFRNSPGKR